MYEKPSITDLGSIAEHTFYRCGEAGNPESPKPKDFRVFPVDKHGECSSGHAEDGEPTFS